MLSFSVEEAILDPEGVLAEAMKARDEFLLKKHSEIKQMNGKDTRYYSYVPDPSLKSGRRCFKESSKEKVENDIIHFYMKQEQGKEKTELTFADCWQHWYDFRHKHNKKLAPSSFQIYRQCYQRYFAATEFANRKISEITDIDIEAFMINTIESRNMSQKSAQELSFHLRNTFKRAYKERVIDKNPWDYVDLQDTVFPACREDDVKRDEEMVLSPEQAEALTKAVEEHLSKKPNYLPDLAILVCKYTGTRPGETVAFKWSDINDDEGYIDLERAERRYNIEKGKQERDVVAPKAHKDRVVPVCPELAEIFARIRKVQSDNGWDSEWVFYWENTRRVRGRMSTDTLQDAMLRRGKEAGIVGTATVYRFRRTIESGLRKQGKSGESVGHMLGHSDRVGREHYAYDMEKLPDMQRAISNIYKDSKNSEEPTDSKGSTDSKDSTDSKG